MCCIKIDKHKFLLWVETCTQIVNKDFETEIEQVEQTYSKGSYDTLPEALDLIKVKRFIKNDKISRLDSLMAYKLNYSDTLEVPVTDINFLRNIHEIA